MENRNAPVEENGLPKRYLTTEAYKNNIVEKYKRSGKRNFKVRKIKLSNNDPAIKAFNKKD